tara:strand:+ start:251 stop:556 length:306 start_codon:yes stop_codon:yes gene_type:complete
MSQVDQDKEGKTKLKTLGHQNESERNLLRVFKLSQNKRFYQRTVPGLSKEKRNSRRCQIVLVASKIDSRYFCVRKYDEKEQNPSLGVEIEKTKKLGRITKS